MVCDSVFAIYFLLKVSKSIHRELKQTKEEVKSITKIKGSFCFLL